MSNEKRCVKRIFKKNFTWKHFPGSTYDVLQGTAAFRSPPLKPLLLLQHEKKKGFLHTSITTVWNELVNGNLGLYFVSQ
jgi:hypothetical protein